MSRPSAGLAAAVGGASIAAAAIAIGVAQIELGGQSQPHIWSNAWLLLALSLAGTGLLVAVIFFVMQLFTGEESKSDRLGVGNEDLRTNQQSTGRVRPDPTEPKLTTQTPPTASADAVYELGVEDGVHYVLPEELRLPEDTLDVTPSSGAAFTERWRHSSDGFDASPLMNMTSLSMPGFNIVRGEAPQLRIGAVVACDPLRSGASSSVIGSKLLAFLRRDPVTSLIESMIGTVEGLTWTRQAGNGALSLEAVLGPTESNPVASALLQPPVTGLRLYGRNERVACLWLHIDPRGTDSSMARPIGLAGWYQLFQLTIALAGAFAGFLAEDLNLPTSDDPAARAGVMIETAGPISDLVDTGDLSSLPGGIPSRQFLGYAVADREGRPADQVALDLLRQLCDHTLHLGDFEGALEAIRAANVVTHPAPRPPYAVQSTWETRELPVLRAVVKLLEEPGSFEASVSQISAVTGIDQADVDRAIEALKGEYITEYQQFLTGGDPSSWTVRGITAKARRAVGQWPGE